RATATLRRRTFRLTHADILGPDGRMARRLEHYGLRPQQLGMAEAVARAIAERRHLLVEAGTGVGRSFAYLVPAILSAVGSQNKQADDKRPKGNRPGDKANPLASDTDLDLDDLNAQLAREPDETGKELSPRSLGEVGRRKD